MFSTDNVILNNLYHFIDGIKGRLSGEELNELTDIYNAIVLMEEEGSFDAQDQLELFETNEYELIEHIQDTIDEVENVVKYSENEGGKLLVEVLDVVSRELELSNKLNYSVDNSNLKSLLKDLKKRYFKVQLISADESNDHILNEKFEKDNVDSLNTTLVHKRLGEKDLLKEGSLIQNKKGDMFLIDKIIRYRYSGEIRIKLEFYSISDNGLIDKSKIKKCAVSDVGLKFDGVVKYEMLDWNFNNKSHEDMSFENVNEESAHEKEIEPLLNNDNKKDIKLNYYTESNYYYPIKFKYQGREFDGIRIKEHKGKSAEVSAMKGDIPYCTIKKRINIDLDEKVFYLSFGEYTVDIGSVEYS